MTTNLPFFDPSIPMERRPQCWEFLPTRDGQVHPDQRWEQERSAAEHEANIRDEDED